uniref:Succinate dehydrogenase subunit 3 n=1 Tax=Gracilaria gracilis TaxID=2777 RepID=A0A345UB91_GRAGA|nr:succinate dehydrogenase subunit 3 [Gracilaria gracilis]AXI97727.1 succinate dehydrogenase subunit 3 [Gracilaria gracilis]
MYNRPLSPHITIYAVQISSLSSIWHRISGILLTSLIVFCSVYIRIIVFSNYNKYLLAFKFINAVVFLFHKIICIIFLFGIFYHTLNGLKQIFWDLGFFFHQRFLPLLFLTISFIICIIILGLIF